MKADEAFDAALARDDHHWDARFSKAVSPSFWPPLFGKQAEAIEHFETLMGQQEALPQQGPKHAQTYLLLGNLYQQQGNNDKALATWNDGTQLFPDNHELAARVQPKGGE